MQTYVANFMRQHAIRLPAKQADNFRRVEPGVYTHTSLPLGPMTDGITDGVVAWFVSQTDTQTQRTVFLHVTNLLFCPAPQDSRVTPTQTQQRIGRLQRRPRPPKHSIDDLL